MASVIRRQYLITAAAAMGGLVAAACGQPEVRYVEKKVEVKVPVEKIVEKVVEKRVEVPIKTAQEKKITFDTDWGPAGPRGEVIKRSLALWAEKHPKVKVDVRYSAGAQQAKSGSVFARTAVLIAADDMGDLFLWAGYVFVYWAKRGLFADLTPYLKQFKLSMDDFIKVPQHEIYPYPHGKIYGFPFQVGTGDWMYNKSLLSRHGITPSEKWTFDDMVEVAKKVQDHERNIWGVPTPGWSTVLLTMYNIGGEEGTDNGTYYLFDTPVGHQAIQFWEDLIHKHEIAPTPKERKAKKLSPTTGNYAFWLGYPSAAFRKRVGTSFEFDMMFAPKWPGNGKRAVSGFDQPHMVTKWAGTHGVVAESALLAWHLAGPETGDLVLKYGNTPPTWKALFDSDRNLDSKRWRRDIIMDGFNYRYGNQAQEWWYPMYRAWNPIFSKVWNGEMSGLSAAREANRLNKTIAELRTLHPPSTVLQAKLK